MERERKQSPADARRTLGRLLQAVLASRAEANSVFDILAVLQSEDQEEIQEAVRTCSRLFGAMLERGELFVGQLPSEDALRTGTGPQDTHEVCTAGRSTAPGEGPVGRPLPVPPHSFQVVGGLLSPEEDHSLLISQFCQYMEYDDIRYHTMQAATSTTARITKQQTEVPIIFWNNAFALLSAVSLPHQECSVTSFYVKHAELSDKWKVTHLKEHRKAFQEMWLGFLKHKLPLSLYKKVLVAMHDSILPHLAQPTLMIDFLTSACDVGGAISLLALNGLFILIHKHNLEYPDFYQKLYGLLDPSIFHVKYRARFFHLADLFLSSSHLPAYLVAAFAKRLARLALTAPPEALLMALPFICNLLRRHPACRILVHRPQGPELDADPYNPDEVDPARSHALESCLWELQTLQQHYHPEVSKAASVINQVLSVPETSIAPLLELTAYEIFERDLKKKGSEPVPLEFIPARGLLGRQNDLCAQFFTLS
uniref:Nucleolar complex protein 4 homolog isoform X2 n=1 Tax=Castor canadensis TaxID=51338 RepID=A0A8B7VZI3_CASCN|nr:nucleolar complex protein 4 homolog isoform X2 [Castor canadensis]